MDNTVFALPREKRGAWLQERRDYIIKRLNADFQKPWVSGSKLKRPPLLKRSFALLSSS